MQISERMDTLSPSQTIAITNLARSLKEDGLDVISLSVGEPDFNTPKEIIDKAYEAALEGQTKYSATAGIPPLKKAIQEKMKRDTNLDYDMDEIFVGTGAKQVLFNIFLSGLNPGDEVIIPTPYWVSYAEQVKFAEGVPVFAETSADTEYKITPEILDNCITDKTKMLVLNSPNNPTGSVYSKEELQNLANYLEDKNIVVVADEIYEVLIYEGQHYSIAQMNDTMKKNTIIVNGVSKSHAMTGWRVGFACGSQDLIKAMTKLQSQSISNVATPSQHAALAAYNMTGNFLEQYNKTFHDRRDNAFEKMKDLPYVQCVKPKGAFYLFPYFIETAQKCGFKNVDEFVKELLREKYVALVPGSAFGYPENLRLSYAINEEKLNEAMDRIKNFIEERIEE